MSLYFYRVDISHGRSMEKKNFPSEQEQEFRPFNSRFFDENNSEMAIIDDYIEPKYDELIPPELSEEELL